MHSLEEDSKNRDTNEMLLSSAKKNVTAQVSLFDNEANKIEQQIKDIDVNNLTPLQALTVLCDLKSNLKNKLLQKPTNLEWFWRIYGQN